MAVCYVLVDLLFITMRLIPSRTQLNVLVLGSVERFPALWLLSTRSDSSEVLFWVELTASGPDITVPRIGTGLADRTYNMVRVSCVK